MGGAEIGLGDDRLRRRRIEELQIGFGDLARALGVDVAVDQRHGRLGEDRQRRRDDVELVLAEFLAGEEGVVFQAISTSPRPLCAKVMVEPRAPVSSTGAFL